MWMLRRGWVITSYRKPWIHDHNYLCMSWYKLIFINTRGPSWSLPWWHQDRYGVPKLNIFAIPPGETGACGHEIRWLCDLWNGLADARTCLMCRENKPLAGIFMILMLVLYIVNRPLVYAQTRIEIVYNYDTHKDIACVDDQNISHVVYNIPF